MLRRLFTLIMLCTALGLVVGCGDDGADASGGGGEGDGATTATTDKGAGAAEDGGGTGGTSGEPERVSRQELRELLADANDEIGRAIGDIGRASDAEEFRQALEQAADVEERQIERLEQIQPPEAAEQPLDQLLAGARAQAERFREIAAQDGASLEELEQQLRKAGEGDRQVARAFRALRKAGFGPAQGG